MGTEAEAFENAQESIGLLIEGESVRKINHSKQSSVTICMVPDTLRNLNPSAYTPRIASIGPLHKEDQHLKAMEEHKVAYMYRLFCRTEKSPKEDIDPCVQAVIGLLSRARACYPPSFTSYEDYKFAEMMVIDGCFILELLVKFQYGIREADPIFDNILVMHDVKHDLLLLENQMPFFILETLFSITVKQFYESISLTDLVFYFFKDMNILNNSELTTEEGIEHYCHHILGLLQSCYRPRATNKDIVPKISYSATEIAGAGVTFKPQKDNEGSLLAVNFIAPSLVPGLGSLYFRETCFRIPVLCINHSTPSILRNLIAYEQCYPLSCHYVTSFAFLMDKLIDSKDDVSLLVKSEVLHHNLGAIEDVTTLFNNICNSVVVQDFYYTEEWKQLEKYCNRWWPCFLIFLGRTFRSTTWKTLSVIAALILFGLTLLQTIYSARNV